MPIYEYHCSHCDHDFEVMQKVTDKPVKTCERCKSRQVHKLISQTSFQLKGGGWYADLYGSSSKVAKKDSPPAKTTSGSSTAKKDSPKASSSSTKASSK